MTTKRAAIIAAFGIPLLAGLAWAGAMLRIEASIPAYVVRVRLPDGTRPINLPTIEGPADASRPLVVIDAGHGGHDPGAHGQRGEQEKAVTLALAKAVRDALVADGRVRVALTRDDDRFLVLDERSGIARRLGADLFVSIHADAVASGGEGASGATIYTLSDRGSDGVADALARRENRADVLNGVSLGGKSDAVSSILVDLSRRDTRARSTGFSDLIVREGQGHIRFHADPQREAAFVVLKSLDLPSVLVEAGYISNPDDVRALTDRVWRQGFAKTLASAIEIYLARQEDASVAR